MKFITTSLPFFAALVLAAPLDERQTQVGSTSSEFSRGGCKPIIFFFARGSTEAGNMVSTLKDSHLIDLK